MSIFTKIKNWWNTNYNYYVKVISVKEIPYSYCSRCSKPYTINDYIYELKIIRYDFYSNKSYPLNSVFRITYKNDPKFGTPDDYNKNRKLFDRVVYCNLKYAERIG